MSTDYVAGKKVGYVPPFRLYLFLSFVFFLIVNFGAEEGNLTLAQFKHNTYTIKKSVFKKAEKMDRLSKRIEFIASQKGPQKDQKGLCNTIKKYQNHITNLTLVDSSARYTCEIRIDVDPAFDSLNLKFSNEKELLIPISMAKRISEDNTLLDSIYIANDMSFLQRKFLAGPALKRINYYFDKNLEIADSTNKFSDLLSSFSYIFLLMLPFTGLILFLIFRRRRQYFYDSFVFAIHIHCFTMLIGIGLFLFELIITMLGWDNNNFMYYFALLVNLVCFGYSIYYILKAIREFYVISWVRTIALSLVTFLVYMLFFVVVVLGTILYALFF